MCCNWVTKQPNPEAKCLLEIEMTAVLLFTPTNAHHVFFLKIVKCWAGLVFKPLHQICVCVWTVQSCANLSDSQCLRMWASLLIGNLIKTSTCLQLLNLPSKQVFSVYSLFHVVSQASFRGHSLSLSLFLRLCLAVFFWDSSLIASQHVFAYHLYMVVCIGCPPKAAYTQKLPPKSSP